MPTVSTVTAKWSGFTGAPGYSRFNFAELATPTAVQTACNAVRTFFDGIKGHLIATWNIQVDPLVQHHDLATGDLTGESSAGVPPTAVAGTVAATNYAGGSGYVVNWITGAFWQGRKVRGRTFIVPAVGVYFTDGTITSATITAAQAAGNALVATSGVSLCVWAKKFDSSNPPQQVAGGLFPVTGTIVPDRAAQLRTRRS